MDNNKERIIWGCTLIGAVSDLVAIWAVLRSDVTTRESILLLMLLIIFFILVYLFHIYKERCEFLEFVEYLFVNDTKKFTLLPKICVALDESREKRNYHVKDMCVRHIYDFSETDPASLLKDIKVDYTGITEYEMKLKNKHIPPIYSCFLGNMYSEPSFRIYQKHGCNTVYQTVPVPEDKHPAVKSAVIKYSWELNKDYITRGDDLPISFKLEKQGRTRINNEQTIIFYPRQYGESVDKVYFEISCKGKSIILKSADLFKIWKNQGKYIHTPIPGTNIDGNTATMTITPCANKYEAYYFNLHFEVAE